MATTKQDIQGARVLLVEDNEINRQVAKEMLEGAGVVVHTATNGKVAVAMAEYGQYELVLMDIQMPVMDGFAATRLIRNLKPNLEIPIIAMTAHAMAEDRQKSLAAGMDDHLTKPINNDELYTSLQKWLKPGERRTAKTALKCPQAEDDDLLLPRLRGIDLEIGLARVNGNKNLYLTLLSNFKRDFGKTTEELTALLQNEKNHQEAQRLAHTVKGVAGNIGARALHHAAAELGKAIKDATLGKSGKLLSAFRDELALLLIELNKVPDPVKPAQRESNRQGSPEELLELLNKMTPFLMEGAPLKCKEILQKVNEYTWQAELAADLENMDELIKKYKFSQALNMLPSLSQKISAFKRT